MGKNSYIKIFYIIIYKSIFKFIYFMFSIFTNTAENKAVFVLSRDKQLEGNLQFVHEELVKQLDNVKIQFVTAENKMNLKLFKEIPLFINAQYLFIDDYYLPIYLIKPRKELKIIQLWHAVGAFKMFGYSTIGMKFGPKEDYLKWVPIHSNYTHVYVSTKNIIPYYAEAFNMSPKNIYPLGVPRIDFFNNKHLMETTENKIYEAISNINSLDVNILLAPTYRADGLYQESDLDMIDIIIKVAIIMNENVKIIFKAHPYTPIKSVNRLREHHNIVVADKFAVNEWMVIADAFITDYSSSIFDYALLQKPLAHFVPDLTEYKQNRGLYQDIEEISDGDILMQENDLIKWINSRTKDEHFDTSRMVNYNYDKTKDISKGVVSHLLSEERKR